MPPFHPSLISRFDVYIEFDSIRFNMKYKKEKKEEDGAGHFPSTFARPFSKYFPHSLNPLQNINTFVLLVSLLLHLILYYENAFLSGAYH